MDEELKACRNCGGKCDPTGWMRGDGLQGPECEGCGITTPDVESWNLLMGEQAASQGGEAVAWLNVATGCVTTLPVVVMDWDDEGEEVQSLYTHPADHVAEPDAELVELLKGLVEIAGRKKRGRPGSPNHSHSIPGIWDSDNGDLAGKPCAECALYDLAVSRIAALQP